MTGSLTESVVPLGVFTAISVSPKPPIACKLEAHLCCGSFDVHRDIA